MAKPKKRKNRDAPSPEDVLGYAVVLSNGQALSVRRIAEYADYDVDLLYDALHIFTETSSPLTRGVVTAENWFGVEDDPDDARQWNGIRKSLTLALGDAEDRAYARRNARE